MPTSPSSPAWHPRLVRPYESLWSILHKLAQLNVLTASELRSVFGNSADVRGELFKQGWATPNDLRGYGGLDSTLLASALRLSPEALETGATRLYVLAPYAAIENQNLYGQFVLKSLRYCLKCLDLSFHTPLFQLAWITECPEHGEPLRTGCPGCGAQLSLELSQSMFQIPGGCPSCGQLLLRASGDVRPLPRLAQFVRCYLRFRNKISMAGEGHHYLVGATSIWNMDSSRYINALSVAGYLQNLFAPQEVDLARCLVQTPAQRRRVVDVVTEELVEYRPEEVPIFFLSHMFNQKRDHLSHACGSLESHLKQVFYSTHRQLRKRLQDNHAPCLRQAYAYGGWSNPSPCPVGKGYYVWLSAWSRYMEHYRWPQYIQGPWTAQGAALFNTTMTHIGGLYRLSAALIPHRSSTQAYQKAVDILKVVCGNLLASLAEQELFELIDLFTADPDALPWPMLRAHQDENIYAGGSQYYLVLPRMSALQLHWWEPDERTVHTCEYLKESR